MIPEEAPAPSAALTQLAGLVLEDGRRWGDAATDHQLDDARAILDPQPGDPPFHFVTRPRGGSKTTDLGGMVLGVLLHRQPPGSTSYGAAADQDQAALLIESIAGFAERTPGLKGAVKVTGRKVTNLRNGATFEALATDLDSSWGLRPAFLVVDEIAQWPTGSRPQQFFAALHSATGKFGAPMVLLTSAGDDAHWSHRTLEHAKASTQWRVSEMPGPVPWADPVWLEEQRALLPEWQYQRLHENRWVGADDRLTSPGQLQACVTLDGPLLPVPGVDYVIAADLGIKNDRTVCVVMHLEDLGSAGPIGGGVTVKTERERMLDAMVRNGAISGSERSQRLGELGLVRAPEATPVRVVLDRIEVWKGSKLRPVRIGDVESWLLQAHQSFNEAPVVLDPWQMTGVAQRLSTHGVDVTEFAFTSQSVGRLASTLHLLLRDGAMALPDDEDLLEELANVRLVEKGPGQIRMDHDPGRHDDRAIAVALAATHLLGRRPVPTASETLSYSPVATLRGGR